VKEQLVKQGMRLMGNHFEISVVSHSPEHAQACIEIAVTEIKRIEDLLTTYTETSETAQINAFAGVKPVKISQEVFNLIQRSLKISEITQGAFDLSYGSIDKSLWNFDTQMTALPDAQTAKKQVRLINYKNIILDTAETSVFLKNKGMRIGFGGIGKGYAAEMAKKILINEGVQSGIVNASGDLVTWGTQPNGAPWTVGVANPNNRHHVFSYLEIGNRAVATSGNYEKFALIQGKKYSHTIDPKTGLPVEGIKSVTIISPNAELSDAFSTPVMVMGIEVGLNLINQIKSVACIIVDSNDHLHTSKNIRLR
jgi:FAD:protein FMN transferase